MTTLSRKQKVGTSVPVSFLVVVVVVVVVLLLLLLLLNKHADVAGHVDRIQVVYGFGHHSEKWCGLY